jgi:hypothetical protein
MKLNLPVVPKESHNSYVVNFLQVCGILHSVLLDLTDYHGVISGSKLLSGINFNEQVQVNQK